MFIADTDLTMEGLDAISRILCSMIFGDTFFFKIWQNGYMIIQKIELKMKKGNIYLCIFENKKIILRLKKNT